MKPENLDFDSFTAGDWWEGIPVLSLTINGVPPAVPLASVRMAFKRIDRGLAEPVILESSDPAQISITSTALWQISIPEQAVPGLVAGQWAWNLKTINSQGVTKTWISGKLTVLEDV